MAHADALFVILQGNNDFTQVERKVKKKFGTRKKEKHFFIEKKMLNKYPM